MKQRYALGRTVDQPTLARELVAWLNKVTSGVYVFREGAELSQFDWGNQRWLTEAELERLWTVRLFCPEFELYARRLDYAPAVWQLRIAAWDTHSQDLAAGELLEPVDEDRILLLGEATGDATPQRYTPFGLGRYQRAQLEYPGNWKPGESCALRVQRFQPSEGAAILCWTQLMRIPTHEMRRQQPIQDQEHT